MYWPDMRPLSVKITNPLRSLPSIFGTLAPLGSKLSKETSVQVPRSCSLSVLVWAVTDWAARASPKTAAADQAKNVTPVHCYSSYVQRLTGERAAQAGR